MNFRNKFVIVVGLFLIVALALVFVYKYKNKTVLTYGKEICISKEDRSDRIGCWQRTVESVLKEKGVHEALTLLREVKQTDLLFSSDCHVYAHLIGEISYWKYKSDGDFIVDDESKLCDYGFYHGFMQEMGHHDGEFFQKAPALCDVLTNQVDSKDKIDALNQCFHGIGHGLVFFYVDEFSNKELEITNRGIDYCRKIMTPGDRQKDCVFGVYGGISSLYFGTHSYLWPIKEENPFWICDLQPEEFQQGCFVGLVPAVFSHWEFDLQTGMDKVNSIENSIYAKESVFYSGMALSHKIVVGIKTKEEIIDLCQSLGRNMNIECIRGLAKGVKHYSLPENANDIFLDLCNSSILSTAEKKSCLNEEY